MITLSRLRSASLDELERLFVETRPLAVPAGCYRGHHLAWTAVGRRSPWRPLLALAFEHTPFGVDFDRRLWFFWHRRLAAGRFEPRVVPSRWRATDAVGLFYDSSRLPAPVKGRLYDEVKPLSPNLCLALAGLNRPRGLGDLFFVALERDQSGP